MSLLHTAPRTPHPGHAFNPSDDQATRLRDLVRSAGWESPPEEAEFEPDAEMRLAGPREPAVRAQPERARALITGRTPIVAITSGKGGVGKTNTAVNLAVALASLGTRATLLDADLGAANADVLCGLMPTGRLEHVVTPLPSGDGAVRTFADIAVDAPGGFRLVPGSAGIARMAELSLHERRHLLSALGELESSSDCLLVDTSAGVGPDVTAFVAAADLTLVVTTPEPTAIADAYALIKCALVERTQNFEVVAPVRQGEVGQARPAPRLALVVNQVSSGDEAREVHQRINKVCRRFLGTSVPMLGFIAQDLRLQEAVRARRPLMLHSPRAESSRQILRLAHVLHQTLGLRDGLEQQRAPGAPFAKFLTRLLPLPVLRSNP